MQFEACAPFGETIGFGSVDESPARINTTNSTTKPPSAVIVTVFAGSSYDSLFRKVDQQSPDPEYSVAVFSLNYAHLEAVINPASAVSPLLEVITDLHQSIAQVEPESVVFNFECCSACSERGFMESPQSLMPLLQWILSNKYTAMFADFSMKSLINDWNSSILGPNPFINLGGCSGSINLSFDAHTLKECSIAQLETVGQMSDGGKAVLHALAGTIVYSIDSEVSSDLYSIEVLTIVEKAGGFNSSGVPESKLAVIGDNKGTVGHAVLKYSAGGRIVTSAGHWMELSKIDVTEDGVLRTLALQYGEAECSAFQAQLSSCTSEIEKDSFIQSASKMMVMKSAPCKYSKSSK